MLANPVFDFPNVGQLQEQKSERLLTEALLQAQEIREKPQGAESWQEKVCASVMGMERWMVEFSQDLHEELSDELCRSSASGDLEEEGVVIQPFAAAAEADMTLHVEEKLVIMEKWQSGWWYGRKEGWFTGSHEIQLV